MEWQDIAALIIAVLGLLGVSATVVLGFVLRTFFLGGIERTVRALSGEPRPEWPSQPGRLDVSNPPRGGSGVPRGETEKPRIIYPCCLLKPNSLGMWECTDEKCGWIGWFPEYDPKQDFAVCPRCGANANLREGVLK